jgi:spermidine/putrescine transport system substrate-binding protein
MKKNNILKIILIIIVLISIVILLSVLWQPRKKLSSELNIYNWEDYLSPEIIAGFEKDFGVKINMYFYIDEFDMLNELNNNPETDKYDLIVAGDSIIEEITNAGLITPIDVKNIPNIKNIDKKFINNRFNVKEFYTIPYAWGTTGMMINTKYVPDNTDSWSVFWDEKYKGKTCWLNDPAEVIGATAKYLNFSLVPQSMEQMEEVKKHLLNQRKNFSGNFCEDVDSAEDLVSEKLWVAQMWNGLAASTIEENPNLKYILPTEGGAVWVDMFAIPKNSKNKYTAEVFLNYINNPKINALNTNYINYATCNEKANNLVDKNIFNNKIIYPSEQVVKSLDSYTDFSTDKTIIKMRDELWQELNKN